MLFTGSNAVILSTLLLCLFHPIKCGGWPNETLKINYQTVLCDLGCICEGPTVFLDCTGRNITKLPRMISFNSETTAVNFQENLLTTILEGTFFDATTITELDLSHNKLTYIENFVFQPFKSLQVLHLSSNNISNLPLMTLRGLNALRILEISHNNIETIPDGFFYHTILLQELKLQYNKLSLLPNSTFQFLMHLERLDLEGNQLITLSTNLFCQTPKLQTLSLAQNKFEEVPKESLAFAKSLHSLDLSRNAFRTLIPGSFSKLYNIVSLHLNEMPELSRVEENAFADLTKLRVLSCSYNKKLTFFHPEAFGHYRGNPNSLYPKEQLLLRENALHTLQEPLYIESWSKLNHLDLRDNPWRCDCKMRWMARLRRNIGENIRCETPFSIHGRSVHSLTEEEMTCEYHWMFSTILLVITSVLAFFLIVGMALLIACYNTSLGRSIRSYSQFSYRKFASKNEDALDLDWDPTGVL